MRCLTLTQPWATLIALGAKLIETRSWSTSFRGPLAIHAAAGLGSVGGKRGLVLQCARKYFLPALDPVMPEHLRGIGSPATIAERLPLGAIVAVCRLVSIHRITGSGVEGFCPQPLASELAFGDYTPGRYAWLLSDIRALDEPIPVRGALGLWRPDAATVAAIRRQTRG